MTMSTASIVAIVCAATFALSVGTSIFISGVGWGKVKQDLEYIKRDVAEIRRLFRLVPNTDPPSGKRR